VIVICAALVLDPVIGGVTDFTSRLLSKRHSLRVLCRQQTNPPDNSNAWAVPSYVTGRKMRGTSIMAQGGVKTSEYLQAHVLWKR
jgi:hypothetical protein